MNKILGLLLLIVVSCAELPEAESSGNKGNEKVQTGQKKDGSKEGSEKKPGEMNGEVNKDKDSKEPLVAKPQEGKDGSKDEKKEGEKEGKVEFSEDEKGKILELVKSFGNNVNALPSDGSPVIYLVKTQLEEFEINNVSIGSKFEILRAKFGENDSFNFISYDENGKEKEKAELNVVELIGKANVNKKTVVREFISELTLEKRDCESQKKTAISIMLKSDVTKKEVSLYGCSAIGVSEFLEKLENQQEEEKKEEE